MISRYRHIKDGNSIKIFSKSISSLQRFSPQEFQEEFQSPYGFVYKITNIENDKIYVGQTIGDISYRLDRHIRLSSYNNSSVLIQNAIRKYGETVFEVEELCACKTANELNSKEKYWIKKLKSNNKHVGYNMTEGGEFSPSARKSYSKRGPHSPEHCRKISTSLMGHAPNYDISGKNNPMYGKSIYGTWLQKYGKAVADEKYMVWIDRCSTGQIRRRGVR